MSVFELFHAETEAVERKRSELAGTWPKARIDARVEERVVVVSGEAPSREARQAILNGFRDIDPDFTVVVGGALRSLNEAAQSPAPSSGLSRSRPVSTTRATRRIYRVREGDTIRGIAEKFYGDALGAMLLLAANGDLIEAPSILLPGWVLEIPEAFPYTIRDGDSVSGIAARFYGDPNAVRGILRSNTDRLDPEELVPGVRLLVPFRPPRND